MPVKHLALCVGLSLVAGGGVARSQDKVELKPLMTTADGLKARYASLKGNLQRVAERMPEADYAFKPTAAMESFAVRIAHIADKNFEDCAWVVDKPDPYKGVDLEARFTTRVELIKLLQESYSFCDAYFLRLSPTVMAETISVEAPPGASFREVKVEKARVALDMIAHNMEMYGYLAVYLRLKGLVPPTSSR